MENEKHVAKNGSEISLNPKGWIEIAWGPLLDKQEYMDIGQRMYDLVTKMEDAGQTPLMLIDFARFDVTTPEAQDLASHATKELGCEKIAGVHIAPKIQGVLDSIRVRSTRTDAIREFKTREEAEAWLLEK